MKRPGVDLLLALVQKFFTDHLRCVMGASNNTIRAYRDALKMFFIFLADQVGRPVADLRLDDIRPEAVLTFLDHLESRRGNSAVTRNCRLAAIRSFAEHLLRHDLTHAEQYRRILAIPSKRTSTRLVSYLEPEDVRAIVAAVDGTSETAHRDRALLLFLYNTGVRVGEALHVRPRDLQLERPRQVRIYGKGGKERICPLWAETVATLQMLPLGTPDELVFRNARGAPITRDGVAYIIAKYVRRAANARPALGRRRVTPHVMRHSCAVALLQAGVDVTVIRDYLGHASIATTSRYIATNLEMKRGVLQAFWDRAGLDRRSADRWRPTPKLLDFLHSL